MGPFRTFEALDRDTSWILRAAAVAGGTFELDLVARVLHLPVPAVREAAARATAAGLAVALTSDGRAEMAPDVVRAILVATAPSLRARYNERIAELLAEPDPRRAALHLDKATAYRSARAAA